MPRYWYNEAEGILEEDPYPNLRMVLAPEYSDLPPEAVDVLVRRTLGVPAEDVEGWFDRALSSVGSAFSSAYKAAAPYVAPVLSGAVQGATTGSALGPWGALGGAVLGGVGGGLSASRQPAGQRPVPGSPPVSGPAGMAASPPAGGQPAGGLAGLLSGVLGNVGGSGAAGQLLSLLSRPEVLQALISMAMGKAGRPTASVEGVPVPVEAFTDLLSTLANQAAAEYSAVAPESSASPLYLLNSAGEFAVDPAIPEQRAARLMEMLNEAALPTAGAVPWPAERYTAEDLQEMREEEYYDMLDMLAMEAGFDEWED